VTFFPQSQSGAEMPELTHEDAIVHFLILARCWCGEPRTAREIIALFVAFYNDTRIIGAGIGEFDDGDMFFIETGPAGHLGIPEIGDFRRVSDDRMLPTTDQQYACISIYRTIHAVDALPEDSEFDDDAFNMHVDMYFHAVEGETHRDWPTMATTTNPTELARHLPEILAHPKLQPFLDGKPNKIEAFVGGAG